MELKVDVNRGYGGLKGSERSNSQQYQQYQQNLKDVSFKNLGTLATVMNFIDTTDVVNYGGVDLVSMVLPRTMIDRKKRGEQAGFETFFREVWGTVFNCLMPGFWALGVASLFGLGSFKGNKLNTKLWATSKSIDTLHNSWLQKAGSENRCHEFVKNTLNNTIIHRVENSQNLKDLANDAKVSEWADKITNLIHNDKISKKELKNEIGKITDDIGKIVNGRDSVTVKIAKDSKVHELSTSMNCLVRDMHDLGKYYLKKLDNPQVLEGALNRLKDINTTKTAFAMVVACVTCFSGQYINRYLTKKKTGKDEFPVYDKIQDNLAQKNNNTTSNTSFKGGLLSLLEKPIEKLGLEFKNEFPHLNHFTLVFIAQGIGRLFAARDKNEFKETLTKDSIGGVSWLLLGGIAGKLYVKTSRKDNELFRRTAPQNENTGFIKKAWNFIRHTSIISYDELKVRMAHEIEKAPDELKNEIKAKYKVLEHTKVGASVAGILWPCFALGFLLTLYNIHSTNKAKMKELTEKGMIPAQPVTNKVTHFNASINNNIFKTFNKNNKNLQVANS